MKRVRWGILGCGKIAHSFAKALQKVAGSELHAVAARDAERAQAFAAEHGAAGAYGSYEALLADPEVDAVYIATIHPQHAAWIAHCAYAGKHVLCEKPLTMNLREAKHAVKVAKEKRCLLREAFMYRHHPQTQRVVDLVESGVIGKVRMIDATFCFNAGECPESRLQDKALGGGGILDVGCYPMSFARLIAGRAQGRLFAEPLELKAVGHLDMQTKVDMWTTAVLRFEGDVLARCTCAVQMSAENQVVIFGERGRIIVESPWFCNGRIRTVLDDDQADEVIEPMLGRDLYAYEIESFAGELRGQAIGARAVGMRLDDSLGNMKALDWWRAEIGLAYEADR
ncbi:Gfo/Idh/MocA family oxidoreductase [Coraliomargarita algicola]|uniref:Gfo/Idh/MocA family oxidoreductase n=1 Tax=Coraliomargarita algicola TaxID=3092156 RepID=A0ABZ0RQV7_9BACT|nr:Gfo/Idh/MocA family oxidoreductase [Coraliomargarita sp. J2-16]WPJ97801.1 Gfo/Idh/MocA family oxidoreductase [Coraliomargarita sp. J2-16]